MTQCKLGWWVLGFAAAGLLAPAAVGADKAKKQGQPKKQDKPSPPITTLVRYVGAKQGNAFNRPTLTAVVVTLDGRYIYPVVVPNKKGADPRSYSPDPTMLGTIKELKKGDVLRVTTVHFQGHCIFQSLSRYEFKPGEDDPMGFVFVKTETKVVGTDSVMTVVLKKMEQEARVLVPMVKDRLTGGSVPDPNVTAAVAGLKSGTMVEVELDRRAAVHLLTYIAPYSPPVRGEYVRLIEEKPEDGAAGRAGVEIKIGGQAITYYLPMAEVSGRTAPDASLLGRARSLRPGELVEVKTSESKTGPVVARIERASRRASPRARPG